MDIDSAIYPRKPSSGSASRPLTSMFFYAKNDRAG